MHELSIALSILDAVQDEMDQRGCSTVEAVHLKVGMLSGIVPEALLSAYELAAEQTPLASARLVIEEVPIVIYCSTCRRQQSLPSAQWLCCPVCQEPAAEFVSGRELELCALELPE